MKVILAISMVAVINFAAFQSAMGKNPQCKEGEAYDPIKGECVQKPVPQRGSPRPRFNALNYLLGIGR